MRVTLQSVHYKEQPGKGNHMCKGPGKEKAWPTGGTEEKNEREKGGR